MNKFSKNYIYILRWKMDEELAEDEGVECNPYYLGEDLGINYSKEKTHFKVWAPTAKWIKLLVYSNENDEQPEITRDFNRDTCGTWVAEIPGDMHGYYFLYRVKVKGKINEVIDPYTRAVSTNSKKGLIVDLNRTNPENWENDRRVGLKQPQDAIIYEVHVRDFSSSPNSGMINKGTYLAFTEKNTTTPDGFKTGIGHLKELGISHVHLLPVFDFASVDDKQKMDYNWGYDPYYYNVPEGSYTTDPADDTRIKEFKRLVQELHNNGLGVIMDVVYNHTYATEDSPFNLLVPGYYYRFDLYGNYSNGSGTGNEIASEKPMVRKFIVDSVKYWAKEYHIDGFRFDLMALHDKKTISEIEKTLHGIDSSILIYGEPWMGGLSSLDHSQQVHKGTQRGMKIAVFNDDFRNAIKGDNDGIGTGFVSGREDQAHNIKCGVTGSIFYNDYIQGFTDQPSESVNYVSSHDNLTLWDKLNKSNFHDSEDDRIKMDKLAQAIILTSQGIPFIQGGEELLRTKFGNHNSYQAGDRVNQLKWERKAIYYDVFKYYQGLVTLRKEHPAFKMENAVQIRNSLCFLDTPHNTVGFWLKNHANNDQWRNIVVLYNPNRVRQEFSLPEEGEWLVVVNDKKAGTNVLESTFERVVVKPISIIVLYQN
ncbi:type I pullulanase [Iocasia frigidifontis]|nr:type I pullulanase [Iocasia fonsfrigidae]